MFPLYAFFAKKQVHFLPSRLASAEKSGIMTTIQEKREATNMNGIGYVLGAIAVYLIGMLVIGVLYAKNKNSEDFYLGGRKPADGRAGPGDVLRRGGGQLDGDRPRGRHLSELAARGQAPAPLFRGDRRHHGAGLPRAALPRQEQDHRDGRRAGHHHFLRALHGLRLRGLRQAVQQPLRLRLHEGDARLRRPTARSAASWRPRSRA